VGVIWLYISLCHALDVKCVQVLKGGEVGGVCGVLCSAGLERRMRRVKAYGPFAKSRVVLTAAPEGNIPGRLVGFRRQYSV
jgi:hypothetical protein